MKKRFGKRKQKKIGLPPGTLTVDDGALMPRMTVIDYTENTLQEKEIRSVRECFALKDTATVSWINVDSVAHAGVIEEIGNHFSIHPLVLEDIAHPAQRPKFEDFGEYLFIVLKMISYDELQRVIQTEQVSLILGKNYVISFQERPGDVFDMLRERIRSKKGRIRLMGADYLAYALMDAIVDNYFVVIEKIGEHVEAIEDELMKGAKVETQHVIHNLKRETIFLRKSVWPLREIVGSLARGDSALISDSTQIFFRDVYDHTIRVIDTVETLRDMLSSLLDLYLSSLSNRMNEVMKVLTIISTIFIPITFIAGVYGMNFERMPELTYAWGYGGVWIIFLVIAVSLLIFFKRKQWL
jgi:magnesium transporter